jgi:hypothetical protein
VELSATTRPAGLLAAACRHTGARVGLGYPATGWKELSLSPSHMTFRAPLHSGTATVTLTHVGRRWLVSHGEKDC